MVVWSLTNGIKMSQNNLPYQLLYEQNFTIQIKFLYFSFILSYKSQ